MTEQARKVLEDCKSALTEIKHGVQGDEWRRRWITVVVLLRAVGHVLKNVDGERSEAMKNAIEEKWRSVNASKPEPKILWSFIEEERNNILKEYKTSAGQGVTLVLGGPTYYHYTINSGAYKDKDQRDVAKEAIEFWENYLNDIDRIANR